MTPPDQSRRPARPVPPSFTPQSRPAARPTSSDGAVPVGGSRASSGRPDRGSAGQSEPHPDAAQPIRRPVRVTSSPQPSATPRPAPKPTYVRSKPAQRVAPAPGATPAASGVAPHGPRQPAAAPNAPARRPRRRGRFVLAGIGIVLVLVLAWPIGLFFWAKGKINHTDALSAMSTTTGQTYLLAGSDSRDDGAISDDGTEGARTDTIMLLHVPESGPTALISLPRDTYVEIPGYGSNKLNAAYSFGGAPLLVEAVENLTAMKVDHYVEVGLGGVEQVVDAVDGIELCLDYAVDDKRSELKWEEGCHNADGKTALSFIRMRYSDPKGDIGRAERQRQLISSLASEMSPALVAKPGQQVKLLGSGLDALVVDEDTGLIDMAKLGLAFRRATGPGGITGTPDIASLNYRPGGIGSSVLLDPDTTPKFFDDIANGRLKPGQVGNSD